MAGLVRALVFAPFAAANVLPRQFPTPSLPSFPSFTSPTFGPSFSFPIVISTGGASQIGGGALSTVSIPIPTAASNFTTTIPGCDTIPALVLVGVPTSTVTLFEGTVTRYLPPQAEATTSTVIDPASNKTEVIVIATLPGTCGAYPLPEPPSPTGVSPSPTPEACPDKGCSGNLVKGATLVIDAINQVSLLSQNLQRSAQRIGATAVSGDDSDEVVTLNVIDDIARGLNNIAQTLTTSIPRIAFLPALPPGCDTDTVIIAFVEFVRIHQALLNILIGRSGLLPNGPVKRDEANSGAVAVYERGTNGFVGRAIATALRAVEGVVDTIAFKLIDLCPTRGECANQEKAKLSASLKEAIFSYEQ